ncbi:hypothetical protein [Azorhizophilus paspali]|uniref:Transposase n=1 Tax=Azorhizophilus paspali TaxID=69963 RepID=A0ABV6SNP1_AZOPA
MKHAVPIQDSSEGYACDEDETVLAGMARRGRKGIPLGCRGPARYRSPAVPTGNRGR